MNNFWTKLLIYCLLLTLIFAPFAGFAPLLLIILILGTYWAIASIFQTLIFGKSEK